ncbi:nuclear transport factor 2 family protein [Saccharopolyspora cebuensis]|uniref:Nuclear transport factor 2 family protein n=1 Tax=Saccharopolyspora cebuensis TaxID=418759 RepID=A0ABV4CGQ3_9PSEU
MSTALPEVLDLLGRQSHAIDGGDGPGWAATFTADGVFRSPTYPEPVRGRAALTRFAAAFAPANPRTRHVVTGTCVDPGGADALVARSTLLVVRTESDGAVRILRVATLRDRLVRVDGRWLIAERAVSVD